MRYYSYLNTSVKIIANYNGEQPFSGFLKAFFAADKKYGSKDRKQISHLCYCYFRLGHAYKDIMPVEQRVIAALFLCTTESHPLLEQVKPDWNKNVTLPVEEKLQIVTTSAEDILPWPGALSKGIEANKFSISFLTQPDLFLRIRPGKDRIVKEKLNNAGIAYTLPKEDCIALSNATKIETVLSLNNEVVVQDYSSQRIAELYTIIKKDNTLSSNLKIWDCCAASGGKSILAKDVFDTIDLTVSDIRSSILHNLRQRFKEAGIDRYKSFQADLTQKNERNDTYDVVICDAPCSGSGTWGRTPEELYFFKEEEIEKFSALQKNIVSQVSSAVRPGGYLLYITCSVFKSENESIAEYLSTLGFQIIEMEVLKGYTVKADTMFAALFKKL